MKRLTFAVAVLFAVGWARIFNSVLGVERLDNGHTIIVDPGTFSLPDARVVEVDSAGRIVWGYYRSDISWCHTARRLANGNTLISATEEDRVIEVDKAGNTVWSVAAGLDYPNEAIRLSSGNTLITDRDNNRVIEVDGSGAVVWSYGDLVRPHNGTRLANGNTLVCDSDRDAVVEVDSLGNTVWSYSTGVGSWPRCAERLPGGNTLIAVTLRQRVIEVTPQGDIVWSATTAAPPYMAARLPDGNTLISAQDEVIELNTSGSIAWRWPPQVVSTTDEISVRNPASGTDLSVHVHRPAAPPDSSVALAVVLVPDGLEPGTVYDSIGLAADLAEAGFVVLHFDPDGRGRSVPGVEDYDGPIHQSGLQACVAWLAGLAYVDPRRIGIYSRGYGITMSSGMVARSTGAPAAFLLDDEGLADRHQASADSGGPVPVPPDSAAFWDVREAARYLKQVPVAYLRMQTETDRGGRLFDNRHAIALIDSATSLVHGGSGLSPWTRVNDSVMNPANRTYTLADPPAWIPEQEETYQADVRILAYLQELALFSAPTALAGPAPSRPRDSRLRASPNPSHGPVRLDFRLDRSGASNLTVQDAAGRVVQTLAAGNMTAGSHFRIWNPAVPAGMYFVTLQAAGSAGCARVVVR